MTDDSETPGERSAGEAPSKRPASRGVRLLRWTGWTLIAAGSVILLYVVYALWFTGFETQQAQESMREGWERQVASAEAEAPTANPLRGNDDGDAEGGAEMAAEAVAMLEFERPGSDERPVTEDPLFIVEDVDYETLKRGPGHYPFTSDPGGDGNFAVAGHRTTYGAPFFRLDDLQGDDEIKVTDRGGEEHVYRVVDLEVVGPAADWVLGEDPLDMDRPMLTLTTCHPRFSAAQRLIVFAELVT